MRELLGDVAGAVLEDVRRNVGALLTRLGEYLDPTPDFGNEDDK